MDKQDIKKILAGLSITSLLAGGTLVVGCTQKPQEPPATTQEAPAPAKEAPATAQEAPAPEKEAPAKSS
jgi:radical SAM modification target selenobiotic family peptide